MPRNQNAGNLALRNRNRVTNKTRLKVIRGNIDADPIVLDEDEERARVVSTAGVDAEDANEHHLQAVLSAASHRATTLQQKTVKGNPERTEVPRQTSTAYIPVPDAAGLIENYSELYPSDKWKEPATYVKFSITVDECVILALADGFTYVMDERDAEWLVKNNQDARGEGTSSQASGSSSGSGTTTRSGGHRSAKSRGKEAEPNSAIAISEDEFELVMGLFERITHDNTPFLHVSFQQLQGSCIPSFSDYHDVFANDLPSSYFATFLRPPNLPTPPSLIRVARAVYPHWRDRKIDREGQRIIPTLNYDESDSKNESYICFRRREIKAVRKTRTAQVSSSDKLLRIKGELASAHELTRNILTRETQKREVLLESKNVWEKRMVLVDLKRKFPQLGGRDEEELLYDRERVAKKPRPSDLTASQSHKIKNRLSGDASASPAPTEVQMRPREKLLLIQNTIEEYLKRAKERDHHWDDMLDNPFQQFPVPYSEKLFKPIRPDEPPAPLSSQPVRSARHIRARVGRGGRMHFDRRPNIRLKIDGKDILRFESRRSVNQDEASAQETDEDRMNMLAERWRYDFDSQLAAGDGGNEEEDRILYDDFEPKNIRHSLSLLQDQEHMLLVTDPRLLLFDNQSNSYNYVIPSRITATPQRRESSAYQRPPQPAMISQQTTQSPAVTQINTSVPHATPVAVQTPVKNIAPPMASQHSRVPSGGPQRPSSSASQHSNANGAAGLSSSPTATSTQIPVKASHGSTLSAGSNVVPNISSVAQASANGQGFLNGALENGSLNHTGTPSRPLSQNQGMANGHQQILGLAHGFSVNGATNGTANGQANGSFNGFPNAVPASYAQMTQNQAQLQRIKAMQMSHTSAAGTSRTSQQLYAQHMLNAQNGANGMNGVNGSNNLTANSINANLMGSAVNMNLKLPTQRQMQWSANAVRPPQASHGADVSHSPNLQNVQMAGLNGMLHVNGTNGHLSPPRPAHSPNPMANAGSHQLIMSPHMNSPSLAHLTPPRNAQTPIPPSPSPLLQHQHVVGGLPQGQNY